MSTAIWDTMTRASACLQPCYVNASAEDRDRVSPCLDRLAELQATKKSGCPGLISVSAKVTYKDVCSALSQVLLDACESHVAHCKQQAMFHQWKY